MSKKKYLLVIVGATAVGKTSLSLRLAQHFQAEIVSADSRQFYKEMNIGTAKPSLEEQALVKHHFINSHSIQEAYNVGTFEQEALQILEQIFAQHSLAILVGGSGLYVRAICEGLDNMPESQAEVRETLVQQWKEEGLTPLLDELKKVDPNYYESVDRANPHRIIRALEVYRISGQTFSSFRQQAAPERPFESIKIGLERPREEIYARIELRMDQMLAQGLREEAESLLPYQGHPALQTVGYQEIFGFLNQAYDWEETVRLLKRNSRRYAKRQLTWFHKDPEIQWFPAEAYDAILNYLLQKMNPTKLPD